jgi:hypothetical protein
MKTMAESLPELVEVEQRYLASDGTTCPFCGSDRLVPMDWDHDLIVTLAVWCGGCSASWRERYELLGMDQVQRGRVTEGQPCAP